MTYCRKSVNKNLVLEYPLLVGKLCAVASWGIRDTKRCQLRHGSFLGPGRLAWSKTLGAGLVEACLGASSTRLCIASASPGGGWYTVMKKVEHGLNKVVHVDSCLTGTLTKSSQDLAGPGLLRAPLTRNSLAAVNALHIVCESVGVLRMTDA